MAEETLGNQNTLANDNSVAVEKLHIGGSIGDSFTTGNIYHYSTFEKMRQPEARNNTKLVRHGQHKTEAIMPKKNSITLIYSITKETLVAQQNQKSVLESKSNTLVGFAGGMIALLIGAKEDIQSIPSPASLLVLISVCLFLVSILLATFVGWVRKYRSDPDPSTLAEHYLEKSEEDVQLQLISNLIGVWRVNSILLERNAIILRFALSAQTLAFIILGIVLAWSLL